MQFWIRHAFLLLSCVVFPFFASIYLDTASELKRVEREGAVAARFASANLDARMTLQAHETVNAALSLSQRFSDRELAAPMTGAALGNDKRIAAALELLQGAAPQDGFAWLVDEAGVILAKADPATDGPQQITGHPLFLETQQGYALDGLWKGSGRVATVGAAPLIVKGQAQGAIFVGRYLDQMRIDELSKLLNAKVTLVADGSIIGSTLPSNLAESIIKELDGATEAASGGFLEKPIEHATLPFLPLFVAHDARGFAFTSISARVPGADEVRWVISTASAEPLRDLAERQELGLAGLVAFTMLAFLIGLMNYRAFVSPIERITAHLSELQQGRGELELAEARVSGPFRRMVKLINMMVQRLPARGFSPRASTSDPSPIAEVGVASVGITTIPPGSPLTKSTDLKLQDLLPSNGAGTGSMPLQPAPSTSGSGLVDALGRAELEAPPAPPAREAAPRRSSLVQSQPLMAGEGDAIAEAIASLESQSAASSSAKSLSPSQSLSGQLRAASTVSQPPAPREASRSTMGLEAPKIPASKTIRSAADIRGVPSESIVSGSPFQPTGGAGGLGPRIDAAAEERTPVEEQLAAAPASPQLRGSSTARGGGSFNLASYAGLSSSAALGHALPPATEEDGGGFNPEATVVAPVADELLRKSASREDTTDHHAVIPNLPQGDMTMVASVPPNLLAQTMGDADAEDNSVAGDLAGLDAADHAHFKETYERFIDMRKRCGEPTSDLAFDRFLAKLAKNREGLIKKYNCRTVRFQVYEKDGKAALKATPVRAR
ncbi:hypothetical protein L6R52_18280 [Myxococcota bacterium]|nr:hypothetical protein [Myxococcota bacterium]